MISPRIVSILDSAASAIREGNHIDMYVALCTSTAPMKIWNSAADFMRGWLGVNCATWSKAHTVEERIWALESAAAAYNILYRMTEGNLLVMNYRNGEVFCGIDGLPVRNEDADDLADRGLIENAKTGKGSSIHFKITPKGLALVNGS